MKRIRVFLTALIVGCFMLATPVQADVVCNTYTHTGDDDSAFPANLPFSLALGSTDYDQVFVSTNGTLTFGSPDGTYWDYPRTPSVSVAGYDWVTFGEGAYLSYGSTANTFCAEWSVRPYPRSTGDLTQIRLVINRANDGGWHGEVVTFGWLPDNLRRGIRFEQGQPVVPMAAAFDVNGGVPVEVAPAPVPTSFSQAPELPTPSPTATPQPTLLPSETPLPSPVPIESITPTQTPTPELTPSSTPLPVVEPQVVPSVEATVEAIEPTPSTPPTTVLPEPLPTLTASPIPTVEPAPIVEPLVEQQVTLEVPALFADVEAIKVLFEAAEAFMNIGSDMTPEQREESQQVIVSAVIVTQLAMPRRMK
jgi:hypothetical protein